MRMDFLSSCRASWMIAGGDRRASLGLTGCDWPDDENPGKACQLRLPSGTHRMVEQSAVGSRMEQFQNGRKETIPGAAIGLQVGWFRPFSSCVHFLNSLRLRFLSLFATLRTVRIEPKVRFTSCQLTVTAGMRARHVARLAGTTTRIARLKPINKTRLALVGERAGCGREQPDTMEPE